MQGFGIMSNVYDDVTIKQVLAIFDKYRCHVKQVKGDLPGIFTTILDTHYVMQGSDIIHVGTIDSIIKFAFTLDRFSKDE